jgi:acyl-CoA hydrolase
VSGADDGTPRASQVVFARPMEITDSNALGKVHGGVVMRAVDSAAGTAAARHCGRVCVTAAIDGLSFLEPVDVGDILIVQARVNDVGRTSLEVGVRVEAEPWRGGPRRHTTSAYLLMVALDDEGRPTAVPPLLPQTDEDRRRQEHARIRRELRGERLRRLEAHAGAEREQSAGGAPEQPADDVPPGAMSEGRAGQGAAQAGHDRAQRRASRP